MTGVQTCALPICFPVTISRLDFSSVFLPKGCYYLSDRELAGFIKALSFGASIFEMKLLPASARMQGMILVRVDEKSLSKYGQEEEDQR